MRVHALQSSGSSSSGWGKEAAAETEDLRGEGAQPIVYLMFEFLKSPQSSLPATAWALAMLLLVILRILLLAVENIDAPPQYYGRAHDNSLYSFVPSGQVLWSVYLFCVIPLIIDSCLRCFTLLLVELDGRGVAAASRRRDHHHQHQASGSDADADAGSGSGSGSGSGADADADADADPDSHSYSRWLFVAEVLSCVPYCVTINRTAALFSSSSSSSSPRLLSLSALLLDEPSRVVLRLLEVLALARALRWHVSSPSVLFILRTAVRVPRALASPLSAFCLANLCLGVGFFFAEPCYDNTSCAFPDLFTAVYYSFTVTTGLGYAAPSPAAQSFAGLLLAAAGCLLLRWCLLGVCLAVVGECPCVCVCSSLCLCLWLFANLASPLPSPPLPPLPSPRRRVLAGGGGPLQPRPARPASSSPAQRQHSAAAPPAARAPGLCAQRGAGRHAQG